MKIKTYRALNAFTLVEIMIVVLIIGILLAIAIPNFVQAREATRAKACVANLNKINAAKTQLIMAQNLGSFANATYPGDPTLGGIVPNYLKSIPSCPEGGAYSTGAYTELPSCSLGANTANPVNGMYYPHSIT